MYKEKESQLGDSFSRIWSLNNELKIYLMYMSIWDWNFYDSYLHIDGGIMLSILKNLRLTLKDTLEKTPKVISNQNLFSIYVSIKMLLKNWPKLHPSESPSTPNFYILPMKTLIPPIFTRSGTLKSQN